MQFLVVPSSPSFLVYKKFVVPSLHRKSAPRQDFLWTEWWFAGLGMPAVVDESSAISNNSGKIA